jgi:hypothetical protein
MPDYQLIRIQPGTPPTWNVVRPLTHEEFVVYEAAVQFLRDEAAARIPLRNLPQAYKDFLKHVEDLEVGDLAALTLRPMEDWVGPMNRSLDGLLIAMRAYVDQTSSHLIHDGPQAAPAFALWDASRQARHKRSAAYRIAYKLRDYVQHGRLAITMSKISGHLDTATNTSKYTFTLACGRDAWLEGGFNWAGVRADVEALDPTFDPRPMLHEAVLQLLELDGELWTFQLPRLGQVAAKIEALLGRADASGDPSLGAVALIEEGSPEPTTSARTWSVGVIEPPRTITWP